VSLLANKLVQRALVSGFNRFLPTDAFESWEAWMLRRKSWRDISRHGRPYLERFLLLEGTRWNDATFLHVFRDSDLDGLHDHPWPWERLILRGEYYEEYHDGTRQLCGPGHYVSRSARELHRVVVEDGPVYTLFRHGPRERSWGFLNLQRIMTFPTWARDVRGDHAIYSATWRDVWEHVPSSDRPQHKQGWLFPRIVK
jgi:hypothetical protein